MLSKEAFVNAINFLKREDEFYTRQYSLYDNYRDIIGDSTPMMYIGAAEVILTLLEDAFALDSDNYAGTDLSWWLYDADFGEKFNIGDIENIDLPENHRFRKPDLSDVDKLYEYLVWKYEDKKINELLGEINTEDGAE